MLEFVASELVRLELEAAASDVLGELASAAAGIAEDMSQGMDIQAYVAVSGGGCRESYVSVINTELFIQNSVETLGQGMQ